MEKQKVMSPKEVFAELEKRGVVQAQVHFEGGNDSGSIDYIRLHMSDDKSVDLPVPDTYYQYINGVMTQMRCVPNADGSWTFIPYVPMPDDALADGLIAPVDNRYGSFAGDFSVDGNLLWYVSERRAAFEVTESSYEYREFSCDGESDS